MYCQLLQLLLICSIKETITSIHEVYTRESDGNYYKYFYNLLNWADASRACISDGAHLAIDDSSLVHQHISSRYRSHMFWIGLSELVEAHWKFVNGRDVKVRYWASGEPNNYRGVNEDCAFYVTDGNSNGWPSGWHDAPCSTKFQFLCQIRGIPEGYTKGSDGNFFKYFYNILNWNDASKACVSDGAQLVIDNSSAVHHHIMKQYRRKIFWIGLYELREADWKFVNGKKVKMKYWASGEPNNFAGINEDCAFAVTDGNHFGWHSGWHDAPCGTKMQFLCEVKVNGGSGNTSGDTGVEMKKIVVVIIVAVTFVAICGIWAFIRHTKTRARTGTNIPIQNLPTLREQNELTAEIDTVRQALPVVNQMSGSYTNNSQNINPQHLEKVDPGSMSSPYFGPTSVVGAPPMYTPPSAAPRPQLMINNAANAYTLPNYAPPSYDYVVNSNDVQHPYNPVVGS